MMLSTFATRRNEREFDSVGISSDNEKNERVEEEVVFDEFSTQAHVTLGL